MVGLAGQMKAEGRAPMCLKAMCNFDLLQSMLELLLQNAEACFILHFSFTGNFSRCINALMAITLLCQILNLTDETIHKLYRQYITCRFGLNFFFKARQ